MKHPHADEKRKPTLERQLEGTGLFGIPETHNPAAFFPGEAPGMPAIPPEPDPSPGPHRVGRRAVAQDVALGKALIVKGTKIEQILAFLRKDYRLGYTREAIAQALGFKLQTVCGRVNDLLTRQRNGKPAPLVYERGEDSTGAAYVYAFTPEALSHSDSRTP